MAELRCPMCGKSNPAELEVCQFCQARLKPLQLQSEPDETPPAETPQSEDTGQVGDELPPWLQSARQPGEISASSSQEKADLPDWLSSLREGSSFGEQGERSDAVEWESTEKVSSDWSSEEVSSPATPDEKDFPSEEADWLQRIKAEQDEQASQEPAEFPDWLTELEGGASGFESPSVPEWFRKEAEERKAPEEEIPEWLSGLQAEKPVEKPLQEDLTSEAVPFDLSSPGEELSDRLADDTQELPDWLARVESGQPADFLEEKEPGIQGDSSEKEEMPDWLSQMSAGQEVPGTSPVSTPEQGEETRAGPEEVLAPPDESSHAEGLEAEEIVTGQSEAEISEWLAADEEELPEWLKQIAPPGAFLVGAATRAEKDEQVTVEPEPEVAPSWVSGAESSEQEAAETSGELEWLADVGQEIPSKPEGVEAPTPEWVTSLGEEAEAVPSTDLEGLDFEALDEIQADEQSFESELSWLSELEEEYAEMPSEEDVLREEASVSPFAEFSEEIGEGLEESLPGWLSEIAVEGESSEGAQEVVSEGESEIAPADLPSWLEAMRPVAEVGAAAAVVEGMELEAVEGAGPLVGLRGVLPAEPDISHLQKPPAYSVKLRVTDIQQAQAELLRELVHTEGEEKPIQSRPLITSQRVLRVSVAAVLMVAVLFSLLTGLPAVALPGSTPEAFATWKLIETLPGGAPVLLAFDYQPGVSGEVETTLTTLMDHLMIKGTFITAVSSVPTGPVQAERAIAQANQFGGHHYVSQDQYINLGYIPGGPTALLSFAQSPRQTMPLDIDGNPAWEVSSLQKVTSLANFALLIVATENPETARAWIEQVQPSLANTPLVMVISAQAQPMVQPYLDSNPAQIQGLLSGLPAGAYYESALGRGGNASAFWTPFSIGLLVAALLIVIGAAINAMLAWQARNKTDAVGGSQS